MASDVPNNIQTHVNLLQVYGFDKKFNGIAFHHFSRIWFQPFLNACGQISLDGGSLKDTYLDIDPGAISGPIIAPGLPLVMYNGVMQIHANEAQMRQHWNRVRRLYAVALSHVEYSCYLYSELETDYANNGIAACKLILARGIKVFDENAIAKMETDWAAMSVTTLHLKIDKDTLGRWYNEVMTKSQDFEPEKTYEACRQKFLAGLYDPWWLGGNGVGECEC